jgi:hypothetical protein
MGNEAGRGVVTDGDLRILIGLLAVLETSYLVDDPARLLAAMKARFRRDSVEEGFEDLESNDSQREALWRLNVRLRIALGEELDETGAVLNPER